MRGLYSGGFYRYTLLRWTMNKIGAGLYKMADLVKRGTVLLNPNNIVFIFKLNIIFFNVLNKL
jgi:hypothetical protein